MSNVLPSGSSLPKTFFAGLADDDDVLPVGRVLLIEVAAGEKRNAPCLEVVWRNVVGGSCGTFIDRQDLTVGARVEEVHLTPAEAECRR